MTAERADARPLLACENVSRLKASDLETDGNVKGEYIVKLAGVREAVFRNLPLPAGGKGTFEVSGSQTKGVVISPDPSAAGTVVKAAEDVPQDAVRNTGGGRK